MSNDKDIFKKYLELTGETDCTISTYEILTYLDGYEKGLEVLGKIKEEIINMYNWEINKYEVIRIIEKYMIESEV